MRAVVVAALLLASSQAFAFAPGIQTMSASGGPAIYLRNKSYTTAGQTIVATIEAQAPGWVNWSGDSRITVRLDPALEPLNVAFTYGVESFSQAVTSNAACTRPAYASCAPVALGLASFDTLRMVTHNGADEIDLIANMFAPGQPLTITVQYRVRPAAVSPANQTAIYIVGTEQSYVGTASTAGASQDRALDPVSHTVTDVAASAPMLTPSTQGIERGQTATLTVSATDQNGDDIADPMIAVVLADERLGSAVGPQVPMGERGTVMQTGPKTFVYTPGTIARSQQIVASFTASSASAVVLVNVGAVAAFLLTPSGATVMPGASQQFTPANATNSHGGNELLAAAGVTYSLSAGARATHEGNGVIKADTSLRTGPETITVTGTAGSASATATLMVSATTITSCTLTLQPVTLAQAEATTPTLTGSDGTQTFDFTAGATLSWEPADAMEQRGATLVALRAGVDVTVTASASVCPGGVASAPLTIRAPQQGDITSIEIDPKDPKALVIGSSVTLAVYAVRLGMAREPVTDALWTRSDGVRFSDEPARQLAANERSVIATAAGTSTVSVSYRGFAASATLQVDEAYLSLRWQLSKQVVRQGELIDGTLIVSSRATGAHAGIELKAKPQPGLQIVGGVKDFVIDVPAGAAEQRIAVPMTAVARGGTYLVSAEAIDPQRRESLLAISPPALVRIISDPEFSEALLVGRVFDDRNKNGRSDDDEPGIGNVTIGLTSGLFVTTDQNGNYHVPALQPESIVAKIDVNTLPHRAPLTTRERVVMTLTPGQIFRADFGVDLSEPRAPVLVQDKTKAPKIVKGRYLLPLVFKDGEREERRVVSVPLDKVRNEAIVTASSDNGTVGHYKVVVRRYATGATEQIVIEAPALVKTEYPPPPDSTHFLVALGEGIIGFEPTATTARDGLYWDGRLAFAYRGRIKGKVLIDAGADTSLQELPAFFQRDPRRVFRNLDPEAHYPVYGDTSQVKDERESGQKLYVRVEAGPFMAKYGAFRTGLSQNQYGRYDRAVVGAAARVLLERPSGDAHKIFVFYSKPESARVHDELYVTGTSLYYLSQRSVVEGSEQIWLETRQQRTGLVRERRQLTPGADYQVDYLAGRVLLESTLSSASPSTSVLRQSAADGDERWLSIDYEVTASLIAAGNGDVIGGRVSERPVKGLELGATGVTELRAGGDHYWLAGGDVTLNVWKPLTFHAEYAHSERTLQSRALSYDGGVTFAPLPNAGDRRGDAVLARLSFDWRDLKAEAYARYRTSGFNDTQSAPGDRTLQYGGTVRTPVFHGFSAALTIDDLRREAYATVDLPGGVRLGRQMSELELQQTIGPVTLLAAARYAQVAPGFGVGREVVIGGGVVWRILPKLAIGAMHQQPVLREGERVFDSLGRDTQLLTRFVVGRDVEVEGAIGYGERGVNGRATVLMPIGDDTKLTAGVVYGGTTIAEGVSVGLRRRTAEGTLVYVDNQYQKTNLLGGAQLNNTNSVQGPAVQMHTGGVETRLFGAHSLSLSGEAGKRNPGGGYDALVERYGAGVGYAYSTQRFSLRSRLEVRFDSVTAAQTAVLTIAAQPSQRTLAGFVRGDFKATETLSFAAWFKGNQSATMSTGAPLAETAEAAVGFAYRPNAAYKPTIFGRYAYTHDRLPPLLNPQTIITDAHIASLAFTIDPWKYVGALAKVAGKLGTLRVASGTRDLASVLAIPRVNVHVTSLFDVSAEYRVCHDKYVGTQHGFLGELSVLVADYVRLGAGYNLSDIGDVNVECRAQGVRGFFIRAQALY